MSNRKRKQKKRQPAEQPLDEPITRRFDDTQYLRRRDALADAIARRIEASGRRYGTQVSLTDESYRIADDIIRRGG
jgi:hypothetical protein